MIKRVCLLLLTLFFLASVGEATELAGRFGVGANWPGIQARYCINDNWMAEGRGQFASNNTLLGARGYFILTEVPGTITVLPYVGAEFDWILSEYVTGGFNIGGFGGAELLVTEYLGIGADVGLYYVDIWSSLGGIGELGLIFNLGVTFYFK
ncbi:hypothetical protein KAR10_08995 [bacterium]|nr:hypothetical protein [bacterium]